MPKDSTVGVEILRRYAPQDDKGEAVKQYWVYILASRTRVLYVGMTNDLERRVREHRAGEGSAFTKRYRINRLVYFEEHADVRDAILREKEIKGWTRAKKLSLINSANAGWLDRAALLGAEEGEEAA